MADWEATPIVRPREWVFIVARGLLHENLNCDGVWLGREPVDRTIFVNVICDRGHDVVLGEVCEVYGVALCDWCYASRASGRGDVPAEGAKRPRGRRTAREARRR